MKTNEMNDVLNFFFTKSITIHIDTNNGEWYNGLIIELHETFLVINDRVLGETPVPFSEIKVVERFKEKRE